MVSLLAACRNRQKVGSNMCHDLITIPPIAPLVAPHPHPLPPLAARRSALSRHSPRPPLQHPQAPTTMPALSSQRRRWRPAAAAQGRPGTRMMPAGRCAASCVSSTQASAPQGGPGRHP